MTFVLFLCCLGAAATWQIRLNRSEELERLRAELERLRIELEARANCEGAKPFLDAFSACLNSKIPGPAPVRPAKCSVAISEDLVRFRTADDQPDDASVANAMALASCLLEAEVAVLGTPSFGAIETIQIDGHTDCQGLDADNLRLAQARSLYLYGRYYQLAQERIVDGGQRAALLSKVATRGFGEHAPTPGSACEGLVDLGHGASVAEDRRVTVTVKLNESAGSGDGGGG